MSFGFWYAVIHVLGRIGVWKPYLIFVDRILMAISEASLEAAP